MEMDGIGLTLVYGQQTGNAGQVAGSNYNDLEESAYSAKITYGNFSMDYRKNEADNSGLIKNGQDEIRMKILKAEEKEMESLKDNIIGKIVVENGELHIYNSYGITNCLIIQMENKREMSAKELINGLKFEENSRVY